ncbi:hypothetical protein NL676_008443 [Syzygium grande]|nr:hypothetical protein NL676_008443 [Syzygium grande]
MVAVDHKQLLSMSSSLWITCSSLGWQRGNSASRTSRSKSSPSDDLLRCLLVSIITLGTHESDRWNCFVESPQGLSGGEILTDFNLDLLLQKERSQVLLLMDVKIPNAESDTERVEASRCASRCAVAHGGASVRSGSARAKK